MIHYHKLRSVEDSEVLQETDFVEDLEAGTLEKVGDSFYSVLSGTPAGQVRLLPAVNDVLRFI